MQKIGPKTLAKGCWAVDLPMQPEKSIMHSACVSLDMNCIIGPLAGGVTAKAQQLSPGRFQAVPGLKT